VSGTLCERVQTDLRHDARAASQRESAKSDGFAHHFFECRLAGKNLGFSPVAKVIPPVVALFTVHPIAINLSLTKTACRVRTGVKIFPPFTAFSQLKLLETP